MAKYEYTLEEPLNREPELDKLVSKFITPNDIAYDRNHSPIPNLDPKTHRITVTGLVNQQLSLSLDDLKNFPQHTVICALQCAGNRRHTMRTKLKEVNGIDWFDGAVMNCKWSGPLLSDILVHKAGLALPSNADSSEVHVSMTSHVLPCQDDSYYGASLPLSRILKPASGIMLAITMNDAPLPPNHGGPVRVVTPGIAGARSVKWLDRICVQEQEEQNYYQQHDYKILPPEAKDKASAEAWWPRCEALHDMPVNSVIGIPRAGEKVAVGEDGCVEVRGYALPSGADGPVVRVEISGDGGKTWTDGEIEGVPEEVKGVELKWAWCLWSGRVRVEKGKGRTVLSRAMDSAGNTQARCPEWNFRGVGYNGYGEVENLEVV